MVVIEVKNDPKCGKFPTIVVKWQYWSCVRSYPTSATLTASQFAFELHATYAQVFLLSTMFLHTYWDENFALALGALPTLCTTDLKQF